LRLVSENGYKDLDIAIIVTFDNQNGEDKYQAKISQSRFTLVVSFIVKNGEHDVND